jgi:hypothetical protein
MIMLREGYGRFVIGVATLALLASTAALTASSWAQPGSLRSPETQPVTDTRERVYLNQAEREKMVLEMRMLLRSVSAVLQGLVAGDLGKAEEAARASGAASAADASSNQALPPQFLQLRMRTHKRFEVLADTIKAGKSKDTVLRGLAGVSAYCVTCHDLYRLDGTK